MSSVAIVGVGAWCALGRGHQRLWEGIVSGQDGHGPTAHWWDGMPEGQLAATLSADRRRELLGAHPEVNAGLTIALAAAREALDDAGIRPQEQPGRWALLLGNGNGTLIKPRRYLDEPADDVEARLRWVRQVSIAEFTAQLAAGLGIAGPRLTVSTACASSTHAIGLGRELLLAGQVDGVLAGGVDILYRNVVEGFRNVGAMGDRRCSPFADPPGMSLGEGAGFVVLSRAPYPSLPLAYLRGQGMACDAFHATASDPSGDGMVRSINAALLDAGATTEEVGHYNAHGTGTLSNDTAETMALGAVFPPDLPVTANKAQLGHAQGAAGVLETIVAVQGLQHQIAPAVPAPGTPRKLAPAGLVSGRSRPLSHGLAVKQGAAFGGANVSLVLGLEPGAEQPTRRDVFVTSFGATGPFEAPDDELPPMRPRGRCRTLDTASQLLATAVQHALDGSRWKPRRDEVGLFVGVSGYPNRDEEGYRRDREPGESARRTASDFTRSVRNAPAGAVARQFELRGPDCTLAGGPGSDLLGVMLATMMMARRGDVNRMLIGGLDLPGELSAVNHGLTAPGSPPPRAGAACLALEAGITAGSQRPPLARVAGIGIAGPDDLASAIERALGGVRPGAVFSGSTPTPFHLDTEAQGLRAVLGEDAPAPQPIHEQPAVGYCEASHAIRAIAAAAGSLRRDPQPALVLAASRTGASLAMRLSAT